jgi:hypothetical protein
LAACSLAAASGPAWNGYGTVRASTRVQLDTTRVRSSGPVAGVALGFRHSDSEPLVLHELRGRIGYGFQPPTTRLDRKSVV